MALKVVVVGAGIAGLCAAVALRRAGLDVEIFEKSAFATEVGAAFSVSPNGARALVSLGFSFERARACKIGTWRSLAGRNLERVDSIDLSASEKTFGSAVWTVHRVDFHSELLYLATTTDIQDSKPATLRLNAQVVDSDTQGAVVLSNGSKHFADLVVAADGLHSVLRRKVVANDTAPLSPPRETGLSAFRFLVDTETILGHPYLATVLERKSPNDSALMIDLEDKVHERHMVWYPCRNGEVQNLVGIHPTRQDFSADAQEGDQKLAMLKEFSHFDPGIIQIIEKSSHVKCWPLYVHDPITNWYNGRILLIGDAAHPMLPFSGQGSNQAVEDAAALGYLFRNIGDRADQVSRRLDVFETVRAKRVARIQTLSKVRLGREKEVEMELKAYAEPPGSSVPTTPSERISHDYGFDIFAKCDEVLRASGVVL